MRNLGVYCFSLLVMLGPANAQEREYERDVTKWIEVKRPPLRPWSAGDSFFIGANYSRNHWYVEKKDGKVVALLSGDEGKGVERPDFDTTELVEGNMVTAVCSLKVTDGWLLAYNEGEFGAALYWSSPDGSARRKISDHQVNQFQREGERVFAIQGLDHGRPWGSMIEIRRGTSGWLAEEFIEFPSCPEAIGRVGEGDYIIATSDALLRVNLDKEVLVLNGDPHWKRLDILSVEVDQEWIYVGMRQYVARCKLGKSVTSFDLLVPGENWKQPGTK